MSAQEECQSTPALLHLPDDLLATAAAVDDDEAPLVPENTLRQSCTRLSVSLEENGLFKVGPPPKHTLWLVTNIEFWTEDGFRTVLLGFTGLAPA